MFSANLTPIATAPTESVQVVYRHMILYDSYPIWAHPLYLSANVNPCVHW